VEIKLERNGVLQFLMLDERIHDNQMTRCFFPDHFEKHLSSVIKSLFAMAGSSAASLTWFDMTQSKPFVLPLTKQFTRVGLASDKESTGKCL
jgi:hypothetical protein